MKRLAIRVTALAICFILSSCAGKTVVSDKNSSKTQFNSSSIPSSQASSSAPSSSIPVVAPNSSPPAQSNVPETSSAVPAAPSSAPAAPARVYVNVMIPEGYTVSQIGDKLQSSGVCNKSDFLTQVNSYPFTESIMSQIANDPNRCYRLEGYLYPNTYQFYKGMKAQDAIGIMLRGADSGLYNKYSEKTIIIASLIQEEVAGASDMNNVSSVIQNRLNAKMKLQFDSTIIYIESYVKPNLSGDINRYNSYYNTYKCPALPEGPICNPGKQALEAAAHPPATDFLYFASDSKKKYTFSHDYIDPKTLG